MYKAIAVLIGCCISYQANANSIQLEKDKANFIPGEEITVSFKIDASKEASKHWWVGVFKRESTNLREYLDYEYLKHAVDNKVNIELPVEAGDYDIKLASDDYDQEKADNRIPIKVVAIDKTQISLKLSNTLIKPDSNFTAQFNSKVPLSQDAWVGIFSNNIEQSNKTGYASYVRTSGGSSLEFKSPKKLGRYELRFFDADPGNLILSLPFTVGYASAIKGTIVVPKADFEPAAPITLSYTASKELPKSSWIGLFSTDQADDQRYIGFKYLDGSTEGTMSFTTPKQKGRYEFRLYSHEGGDILVKQAFTVTSDLNSESLKKQLEEHGRVSLYGIYFDTDKSIIKTESEPTLELLGALLNNSPELNIEVQGHTDNIGSDEHNVLLSEQRATAVRNHLIDKQNIAETRLTAKGYGESSPKHSNESEEGRAKNRRVDIVKM